MNIRRTFPPVLAFALGLAAAPAPAQSDGKGSAAEGAVAKPDSKASKRTARKRRAGKPAKGSDPDAMKKKNVTGVAHTKGVQTPVQKAP